MVRFVYVAILLQEVLMQIPEFDPVVPANVVADPSLDAVLIERMGPVVGSEVEHDLVAGEEVPLLASLIGS